MILEQFYLGCLAQASYLIGDERTGEAAVVDPRRDVDEYIQRAAELGLRIRHVVLTHFHADFVAGHLELRDRVGARIYLGAGASAEYDFQPLADGDAIELGDVRLEAVETPGHTPESISLLVLDGDRERRQPRAVLTGDTLFIGDVGRPDLAASAGWSATDLAGLLYDSLHTKLLALPDETLVYPAHGAGSLCGKNLSTDTVSTIGAQRRDNYALQPMSKAQFVETVTADQPQTPSYFSYDAALNASEHTVLDEVLHDERRPLPLADVLGRVDAQVLDTRDPTSFAGAHLRGSINIGLDGSYATWAGTLLDRERPIVLVAEPGREAESALRLGRIGLENVAGHLDRGMQALDRAPDLVERSERITASVLVQQLGDNHPPALLDVRTEREWRDEHIEGSVNLPLASLLDHLDEIPQDRRLVVLCGSGYRSSIATSLLRKRGFTGAVDLIGGMGAWNSAGLIVWTAAPLNAETPCALLARDTITPSDRFFVRTHGSVPTVEPDGYRLTVDGLVRHRLVLSLEDLRQFDRVEVTAALQCAGNRRNELDAVSPIEGEIPWGPGAVGNGVWRGVLLADVLDAAGCEREAQHVAFTGLDEVSEHGTTCNFGGSIPIESARWPNVLLADELGGEPLTPVHGSPLRVVVPGTIGARSVKWLATITVQREPSASYFQGAYRLVAPAGATSDADPGGLVLGELPVNSAICELRDGVARGYALTGGRRRIERVEWSLDDGGTWRSAELLGSSTIGGWQLWQARVGRIPPGSELVVRAWDSSATTQPERPADRWNVKGYLNNAWHRLTGQ